MKNFFLLVACMTVLASCNNSLEPEMPEIAEGRNIPQQQIGRVLYMPYISGTYQLIDWYGLARGYDAFVFDRNATDEYRPLVWTDASHNNVSFDGFGLYTTVGDSRQGPQKPGAHEAINTMAAVLGAGLVGIDKTNQDGFNYPRMLQQYYGKRSGWRIMLNNTSGYSSDWWYNILPNVLYSAVCDVFPDVEGSDEIQRNIADQFVRAEEALGGNYSHSAFNFANMSPIDNNIPKQEDAAGGHGYVLLHSYLKFGDETYLDAAKSAIEALDSQTESRLYEILLPYGAYCAAYLNATAGTSYDVLKMLDWTFDGCKSYSGRYGWGVINEKWGQYDVYGLQGSWSDGGGYAFLMNSFEMAMPLVPLVKYAPQYAHTIAKWMYHAASATRLFYPEHIDDANQFAPELKAHAGGVIGYEGLKKRDRYGVYPASVCPVAEGDGPSWTSANGTITMFSLYSSSPVGIFGSIISPSDVEGIIRLDCNVTDFYTPRKYPVNLYYNPYSNDMGFTYDNNHLTYGRMQYANGEYDLYDVISGTFVAKGASGKCQVQIPGRGVLLVVEIPAGEKLYEKDGNVVDKDGYVISYGEIK
ncbi:MAG: hypothetical protein ACI3ZL_09605 [Candidatus Cryptobacteroides sp.]